MRARALRLAAASVFSSSAVLFAGIDSPPTDLVASVLLVAPFAAAILLWAPRLEAQLTTRAILWGYLFWAGFGSVLIDSSNASGDRLLLSVGLCTAAALLCLPADGLKQPPISARFAPVAFRGIIVLIITLALTDAMVLGTSFLGFWDNHYSGALLLAFLGTASAVMLLAVVGLLRMRAWGFALNLIANLCVATLAWCIETMPWELALGLSTTAGLQLMIAAPLARRIASPGAGDPSERLTKLAPLAIAAMAIALLAGRIARWTS